MANVALNIETGYHLEAKTARWVLSDAVSYISFTNNGPSPTISEYIAYDTLSPPNPFIAVTQDGKGNVVYDGGFPKFYNNNAPAAGVTQFSQLTASFKFLYNAINFIANKEKVAAGNRKVLLLGDRSTASYCVKDAVASSGFNVSFTRLAQIGNWNLTVKDTSDYPNELLNPSLAELEQYVAVILMSSQSGAVDTITQAAVTDFVTWRERGNGIMLITDHGANYARIEDVAFNVSGNFFDTANRLAVNFGAYFTGVYDRTPVNVGFLRRTYGDHPLYANMSDSEDISAGGSESKVVVASFDKYTQATAPAIQLTHGSYSIKVMAVLKNGETEVYNLVYVIATGELLVIEDDAGNAISELHVGFKNTASVNLSLNLEGLGTIEGVITQNEVTIGKVAYDNARGARVEWFSGSNQFLPVKDNDVVQVKITSPFDYTKRLTIKRYQPDLSQVISLAEVVKRLREEGLAKSLPAVILMDAIDKMNESVSYLGVRYTNNHPGNIEALRQYFNDEFELPQATGLVFPTAAATQTALNTLKPPSNREIFDTWDRFDKGVYLPNGSNLSAAPSAGAWVWDEGLQAARITINSDGWSGFVSKERLERYELEVTMTSSSADDDGNGVMLAGYLDNAGIYRTLNLIVHRGGINPAAASHSIQINTNVPPVSILHTVNIGVVAVNTGDGWSGRYCRVRVVRDGDYFTVVSGRWSSDTLDKTTEMSFSLNDTPELAAFKGPRQYGYLNYSQADSIFKDITFKGGVMQNLIVDMSSNKAYLYTEDGWTLQPGVTAHGVYGAPRRITSMDGSVTYLLNKDGTITRL